MDAADEFARVNAAKTTSRQPPSFDLGRGVRLARGKRKGGGGGGGGARGFKASKPKPLTTPLKTYLFRFVFRWRYFCLQS